MRKFLRYNLWFCHDLVKLGGEIYLERWYMYLLGFTLRLHKFHRGDDERAVHDHPWPFLTLPFKGYWERIGYKRHAQLGDSVNVQYVAPFRFHYRPSSYQHIVLGSDLACASPGGRWSGCTPKPFFTFVITGRKDRSWGFWPNGKYVYYKDFK